MPALNDWIENFDTAARSDDIKHMPFYEIPHYTALRTRIPNGEDSLYVEYSYKRDEYPPYSDLPQTQVDLGTFPISMTSEIEFVNMRADPNQMRPAATAPDASYATRMQRMITCSGAAACARLEDARTASDYDGDTLADLAVWRPTDGSWHIRKSSNSDTAWERQWGAPGDVPLAADFDGDGVTDLAVWRPADGSWHIALSLTGNGMEAVLGQAGDIPLPHLAARYFMYGSAMYGGSTR